MVMMNRNTDVYAMMFKSITGFNVNQDNNVNLLSLHMSSHIALDVWFCFAYRQISSTDASNSLAEMTSITVSFGR